MTTTTEAAQGATDDAATARAAPGGLGLDHGDELAVAVTAASVTLTAAAGLAGSCGRQLDTVQNGLATVSEQVGTGESGSER